eukprot:UN10359
MSFVAGTMMGLEEDQQINSTKPLENTEFKNMMNEYKQATEKVQNAFWNSLDDDDKNMYGWIQSVWGPNMFDQTQLTISTYV